MSDLHFTVQQVQAIYTAGFRKCLETMGKIKPYMSLKQAYDMYGRNTVNRWADEGLITVIKDGPGNCKCRVSREQIELVASMSNRCSWHERRSKNKPDRP